MLDVDDLLQKTSRTFALAIPLLPEPVRAEVGLAYLLFRAADTFEDANLWPRAARVAALGELADLVLRRERGLAQLLRDRWLSEPPVQHAGYLELIERTPELLDATARLAPRSQEILVRQVARTAEGMSVILARSDERGGLRLQTLEELRDYCYVVAGIVGELLTELFLRSAPQVEREKAALVQHTRAFAEGLQLVNVLKDEGADAADGRAFLPPGIDRAEVAALARADLDGAGRYVAALQRGGAPAGYLAFTGLAVMLARASLDRLDAAGTGAKVSRDDVSKIFSRLEGAIARGDAVQALLG